MIGAKGQEENMSLRMAGVGSVGKICLFVDLRKRAGVRNGIWMVEEDCQTLTESRIFSSFEISEVESGSE